MKLTVIEHQIYMCSACRHIARRLVFRRGEVPITHSPVTPISVDTLWKERIAARGTWRNAVEKLRSRQIDIKERAVAAKIAGWTKAVEKVRSKQAALAEQAACAPSTALRARSQTFERGRSPTSQSANTLRQVETERVRSRDRP